MLHDLVRYVELETDLHKHQTRFAACVVVAGGEILVDGACVLLRTALRLENHRVQIPPPRIQEPLLHRSRYSTACTLPEPATNRVEIVAKASDF